MLPTQKTNKEIIDEKSKMLNETLKLVADYKKNLLKQYNKNIITPENNLPPQAF